MGKGKTAGLLMLFAFVVPVLAGCGTTMQARSVDLTNALLVNPDVLVKGGPGQAMYRYVDPSADFKKYSKLLIDPVIIYKEGEMDAEQRGNNQILANNLYAYLTEELGKDMTVVKNPEPGTIRLTCAIVNVEKTHVVRNVITTVVPVGVAISTAQYAATGKPSGTGSITGEARVTDAVTGKLLGMGIDKQVGGKSFESMTDSWHSADEGMKNWSKMARYNMCQLRTVKDCMEIKP